MSSVKLSKRGQIVIPKEFRDRLGLKEGMKLKAILEGKRIVLIPEVDVKIEELQIHAKKNAVKNALEESKKIEDEGIKRLLRDLGVTNSD